MLMLCTDLTDKFLYNGRNQWEEVGFFTSVFVQLPFVLLRFWFVPGDTLQYFNQRLLSFRNGFWKDHFATSCVQGSKNALHQGKQKGRISCCNTTVQNTGKEQLSQSLMYISEKKWTIYGISLQHKQAVFFARDSGGPNMCIAKYFMCINA